MLLVLDCRPESGEEVELPLPERVDELLEARVSHDIGLGHVLAKRPSLDNGDDAGEQVLARVGRDQDAVLEDMDVALGELRGPALSLPKRLEEPHHPARDSFGFNLDRGRRGGDLELAVETSAFEIDLQGGEAAALLQQALFRQLAGDVFEELHQQARSETLTNMDARLPWCHLERAVLVISLGAHLEVGAAFTVSAFDAYEARVERHRSVEPERELAPSLGLHVVGSREKRAVDVIEVGFGEGFAVEAHPHVVGVDVEADFGRALEHRRLNQLQHVAEWIRELELTHFLPRLVSIECERALGFDRPVLLELGD